MQSPNSAEWWFLRPEPCFADRAEGGRALAAQLKAFVGAQDVVVLALPRGGVPVAFEVARALGAPLELLLVRKLGTPGHEELAMGAIAEGGVRVVNAEVVSELGIGPDELERVAEAEQQELARRALLYREGKAPPELRGRTAILVDDGLATGMTMRAAIASARAQGPARLLVAVPVAAADTAAVLRPVVDELIAVKRIAHLGAIGLWYADFSQTRDDEVCRLLHAATERQSPPPKREATPP
jgi:predicted phosphoribosyltransferase